MKISTNTLKSGMHYLSMLPLSILSKTGERHYRLADLALVGDAVTLGMRTNVGPKTK